MEVRPPDVAAAATAAASGGAGVENENGCWFEGYYTLRAEKKQLVLRESPETVRL